MKLLLLGKDGQVGWELQRALAPLGQLTALGHAEADFSDPLALRSVLARHHADVIVNAAAYTAVDKAEAEPELARAVNAESVAVLAEHAAAHGSWLVHYSTDYVFDGAGERPWDEDDPTDPLCVYGRTKRDGEVAIAASGARHLVFRTAWVHGGHGANFARTMLRLARERDTLRVVADQVGAPTSAELIADVTAHALRQTVSNNHSSGLYHLAAAGETSWHDYAQFVIGEAIALGMPLAAAPDRVEPIATADYPTAARRPLNSRLDTGKLCRQFDLRMPDWREGVRRTVRELLRQDT
jgi:dTDP-4-dehydrorhamnose reductase